VKNKIFSYPIRIKEVYLDLFGHMNNAVYLTLFEEARWEFINENGYGLNKIMDTGLGPVVLAIEIKYLKELKVRDQVIIETQMLSYSSKIGKLAQRMVRGEDLCCTAEFTFGLFNLKERKLISPTQEWLKAIGIDIEKNKADK